LEECAVPFEIQTIDLQNKPKEFIDLYKLANPLIDARSKVPLLEDRSSSEDVTILCESLVVTDYVAERYGGGSLLPPTASDQAKARLFTELCSSLFSYFPILRAEGDDLIAATKTYKDGLVNVDAFLRGVVAGDADDGGPFLLGTRFSTAECNSAPFVQRACTVLPEFAGIDPIQMCDELGLVRLKRWMEAVLSRPSVVATGVARETMLTNTSKMLERFAAMSVEKK